MGSVRVRTETGNLYLDFRFRGIRCREYTTLRDSAQNRKVVKALMKRIDQEIATGAFDYEKTFPGSKMAETFCGRDVHRGSAIQSNSHQETPLFHDFAETWYQECLPQWRPLHQESVRGVLDKYLLTHFGDWSVGEIRRADILAFRSDLSRMPGRRGKPLGNNRINKIMTFMRQILNEASVRYELRPAFQGIKPLKIAKADVHPFSLEEVNRIIASCRADYRNYFVVRFFTGMRTGEIHGLRWRNVDLDNGLILIRETLVKGEISQGAKTYDSCRDIPMLPAVRDALLAQRKVTPKNVEWVFWNKNGSPYDANNFTKRVWRPLLAYLDIEYRRPYQTRHTTATLMLAAGESPEWIARVLGHSTTEMLFKTYSRYVPNLTRQDGSAMARLLASQAGLFDPNDNNNKEND